MEVPQPLCATCGSVRLVVGKLPYTQFGHLLFQFVPAVAHPPAMPCCKEPSSTFSAPSPGAKRLPLVPVEATFSAGRTSPRPAASLHKVSAPVPAHIGSPLLNTSPVLVSNRLGTVSR